MPTGEMATVNNCRAGKGRAGRDVLPAQQVGLKCQSLLTGHHVGHYSALGQVVGDIRKKKNTVSLALLVFFVRMFLCVHPARGFTQTLQSLTPRKRVVQTLQPFISRNKNQTHLAVLRKAGALHITASPSGHLADLLLACLLVCSFARLSACSFAGLLV